MSGGREPLLALNDMVDAIHRVLDYAAGVPDDRLLSDPMRADAIMFALTVVGEAVKQLPDEIRVAHTEVPWSALAQVRDVVVHRYHGVDGDEIRQILREDLPRDLAAIEQVRDEAFQVWRNAHPDGEPV